MTESHPPDDPRQQHPQQPPPSSYPGSPPSPPPYPGDQQGGYGPGYGGPGYGGPPAEPPTRPGAVRNAVWLMIAGAVLTAISIVVGLATIGDIRAQARDELDRQGTDVTPAMVDAAVAFAVAFAVVFGVVGVLLWLWMAWKNGQGRAWARIVATVLAALNLLFTLLGLAGTATQTQATSASPAGTVINVVQLVVAIAVVVLLWSRPARAYFDEVGARRAAEKYAPGR